MNRKQRIPTNITMLGPAHVKNHKPKYPGNPKEDKSRVILMKGNQERV